MLDDLNRRSFLLRAGLVTGTIFLDGCIRKMGNNVAPYADLKGSVKGPDAKAGHLLRGKAAFPASSYTRQRNTVIIGSGISGLSAARWLKKHGHTEFEILELEDHAGGNAHSGENKVSAYPLGAHYITIANNEDELLIDFLQEQRVITHFENGLPFYNEFFLCFDPEERLLINGQWQEGLIPQFGVSNEDKQQIKRFFEKVSTLKQARGNDGKYAFTIPIDQSSADVTYRHLDKISFKVYLMQEGYTSKYLFWYLDYCCKDDYGQHLDKVSAWAGLSYFAGHKGKSANASDGDVLTWPEGNGWLVNQLQEELKDQLTTSSIVHSVRRTDDKVLIGVYDLIKKESYSIEAQKVIMASPQYVNHRILKDLARPDFQVEQINYAPWMVANITLKDLAGTMLESLNWDNVPYDKPSVGYVYSGHQHLNRSEKDKVITFYLPLCDYEPRVARLAAYSRSYEQWLDKIIPEMEYMHPGIIGFIADIEIWIWGHGMVVPSVTYLWGKDRQKAAQPINNQIFFAHTDLSGISLFEEGFHQGIRAAKEVLEVIR
jgi:protoporphyrinogen oxidase